MFPPRSKPPGFLIAAPRSGSGKTTVTLGLVRALKRRGLIVRPFKCGPDYIDPAFHEAACGRPCYNLDSWAMRKKTVHALLNEAVDADLIVIEAAMGLFDGAAAQGAWGNGASADIAALAGLPAVLVLDIAGQAQSAAAAARGFSGFQPGVRIGGVILNRAASARHEALARAGFEQTGMPVLGALPRNGAVALPERHLGLVQARELGELSSYLDGLASLCESHIDIDALLTVAVSLHLGPLPQSPLGEVAGEGQDEGGFRRAKPNPVSSYFSLETERQLDPPGQRIALAQDAAFSFIYPHLLKAWRDRGAEILPFSPLADEAPDPSAGVAWLPGGYPELHAGRLASNKNFLSGVKSFAAAKPVHGECGGYMVLGDGLIDSEGKRHAMLGLLRLETSFAARKLHLGYRRAELLCDCVLGCRGHAAAGHEFHYAAIVREDGERLFGVKDANGESIPGGGLRNGGVTGSFFHLIDRWDSAVP
jgi:cobyrinic acid a,c-diamide synthase